MTGAVTGGRWRYDRSVARAHAHTFSSERVCVCRGPLRVRWRDPTAERSREGFAYLPSRHLYKPDALSPPRPPPPRTPYRRRSCRRRRQRPSRTCWEYVRIFLVPSHSLPLSPLHSLSITLSLSIYPNTYILCISTGPLAHSAVHILYLGTRSIGFVWTEIPSELVCFPMQ